MSNLVVSQGGGIPSAQEFATMKELGNMAIKSGLLPTSINTPEKAIIIMLKGRELGIPPMQAFSSIAVINGKPTMSAELMLGMIFKNVPGAVVDFITTSDLKCEIEAKRPNGKKTKFSFTIEDAKRANLTGKGPWVTYPAAMLRARCISAMARAMFPDALSGVVYTPEELGASVDDEGNVLDVAETVPTPADKEPAKIVTPLTTETRRDPPVDQYVIPFGKHKGNKLADMDIFELNNYVNWVIDSAKHDNKEIKGIVKEFIEHAEAFLCSREVQDDQNQIA